MRIIVAVLLLATAESLLAAQTPESPRFEVVSIRPNNSIGQGGVMSGLTGSQFTATNIRLRLILLSAYDVRDVQLIGAPDWATSARFDISAKYPDGTQSAVERRLMVQNMLADYFKLVVRRETRELPIYRLVMARDDRRLAPNLTRSEVDCEKWLAERRSQIIGQSPIGPGGARPACMMVAQTSYILGGTRNMAQLARALEGRVARPVVDETGLTGNFDIDLQWSPTPGVDPQAAVPSPLAASGVSIFTALQEQLGLKLEPARGPVDALVVESISRPVLD